MDVDRLEGIGRSVLGRDDLALDGAEYEDVAYPTMTIATESLRRARLTMTAPDGATLVAKAFVKELRSPEHWPMLHVVPPEPRADLVKRFPWRLEIVAYTGPLRELMPTGMRFPALYAVEEIGPGRAAMWLEDVDQPDGLHWDLARFRRAAYLLGRLSGRRAFGDAQPIMGSSTFCPEPGSALRYLFEGRVRNLFLPAIMGEDLWSSPAAVEASARVGDPAIIDDLRMWTTKADELFTESERLPMTYAHGDASPQNLLVPADDPDAFVAIDVGLDSPLPVGHDLGQLLVGLCHAGELDPDLLPEVSDAIVRAHVEGLASVGHAATAEQVRYGYLSGLVLRSGFTSLPLERSGEPPCADLVDHWAWRLRMTRAILDLAADL